MYDPVKAKQYRDKYKEQIKEYNKQYRENNPNIDKKYYYKDPEYKIALNKRLRDENPIKYLVIGARSRANKNGTLFDIEWEDIEKPTHCPVFGCELIYNGNVKNHPDSASLDRIIPSLGYTKGNVRIISRRANTIKNNATIQELKQLLQYMKENTNE
jgi:hypothetical protein